MGTLVAPPPAFVKQMTRLEGLKFAPAELTTHWEALADIPARVLEAAVSRAQRTRVEFPSPAELREDCDAVSHLVREATDEDRGQDLPAPVALGTLPTGKVITAERVWKYYHEACGDTGMESLWCGPTLLSDGKTPNPSHKPWQAVQACERTKDHDPHEWVRRCTCWDSNPALVKKREREQKFADQKAKK